MVVTKGFEPLTYRLSTDYSAAELLEKARETYNVYHIHVRETRNGKNQSVVDGWKQVLGENLIEVQDSSEIAGLIAEIVVKNTSTETNVNVKSTNDVVNKTEKVKSKIVAGIL